MRPGSRPAVLLLLSVLAAALSACSSGDSSAKLTRELLTMPKEEAYAQGEQLIAKKKWDLGRQYLRFVAENYANDPIGRQAALKLADSFFDQGTPLGYLEAQARYKDFRNRYPSSPRTDYALYRLAQTADKGAEKPDREQTNTRLAASSYRELIVGYPDSPYISEARVRLQRIRNLLAEHEYLVGRFYYRRKGWTAARGRFETILAAYPDYGTMDRVLYELGLVERRLGNEEKARESWKRLSHDFPNSQYVKKIPPPRSEPKPAQKAASLAFDPTPRMR
ncbi:MAG: outer membrane protein assembly factor BamD [Thermoanaerobaculia bacterium]